MRIVLLPSAYAPAVGGVEELTANLAQTLLAAGDEVEVWTIRHPKELPALEVIDGVRVRRFELPLPRLAPLPLIQFPVNAMRAWGRFASAAAEFRPDVLHVQCFSANGVYAHLLSRRLRVPLVVTLQGETMGDDNNIYGRSFTLRRALRWALRRADVVTGCSRLVIDDAEARFGLAPGRAHVVPNGVDLDADPAPEAVPLPFDRFVLGLGRVVENKGFDLLLDAFGALATRHDDVGLVIAGDGPARAELVDAAAAAGLGERVAFPGTLSRSQVAWVMRRAEVFILPSRVDAFGIVVLEALRAGTPVIVSARTGATEIVRDGVDGLVVDPRDRTALATAIETLLVDERLSDQLRRGGPVRAAEFDWRGITRRYRELAEAHVSLARRRA